MKPAQIEWALFGGAAVFYAALATTTVQGGDSGELTAVAATLGVAHPPGYPLFTLLGHAAAQLPAGTIAWRVGLVSSLAAAWTLFALARTLRLLAVSRAAIAVTVAALGLASTFVYLAGVAEVFTLNTAVAASLLLIAALLSTRLANTSSPSRPPIGLALAFGLAVGLGASNHHTIIIPALIALVAAACSIRIHTAKWRMAVSCTIGAPIGLTPYLYLLAASSGSGAPRWGETGSLEGLIHHVLRKDYGTLSLGLLRGTDSAWDHLGAHLARSFADLGPAILLLAVFGAVASARGTDSGPRAHVGRASLAAWILSGPGLHALFNIPVSPYGDEIGARFDILPNFFLAVLAAIGLDRATRFLAATRYPNSARFAFLGALGAAIALQAALRLPDAIARRHTLAESYGRDVLALLPPNALLFIDGDRDFSVLTYLQEAAAERRDVRVIHVALLGHRWYVEGVRRSEPALNVPFVPGRAMSRDIMSSAHNAGRHVFVTQGVAEQMSLTDRFIPYGLVVELLAPTTPLPTPETLETLQRAIADRVYARPPQSARPRASDANIPNLYTSGYRQLRAAYERANDTAGVVRCDKAAEQLTRFFANRD